MNRRLVEDKHTRFLTAHVSSLVPLGIAPARLRRGLQPVHIISAFGVWTAVGFLRERLGTLIQVYGTGSGIMQLPRANYSIGVFGISVPL